jgi:hypothetical protein
MSTSKNIGYHTRLIGDNSVKVVGGSFGGDIDIETVNRLTRFFTVTVKPSGTPVFVDDKGREVRLYITIDPCRTNKGMEALKEWRVARAKQERADAARHAQQSEEIDALMSGLSHEEVVRRLKGAA